MRLGTVHDHRAALDNKWDALLGIQRLRVWSYARTWVVRPVPESASCEVAEGSHNAHTHVIAVSVSFGRVVTVDANRREGKTHPVVQTLWWVVLKEAAEQSRHLGKPMSRLRDNKLGKGPDPDKTQHFRMHKLRPVGYHIYA